MEPPTDEPGGLLVRPERPVFKAPPPRTSMLGLDKLAAQKRAELAERESKRVKLSYEEDPDSTSNPAAAGAGGGRASGPSAAAPSSSLMPPPPPPPPHERRFRGQRSDTPSHPGGVSSSALESLAEQRERQRARERAGGGLYVSTTSS
ncbi:hypothetical protein Agub_g12115, partial [Astrephomene gubernaculifera]